VTVVLASIVFGETLGPLQLVGGALVLAAVPVLHMQRSRAWNWGRSESGAAAPTASTP
jgi:drug/metabolite transporter (DMT)-like permease